MLAARADDKRCDYARQPTQQPQYSDNQHRTAAIIDDSERRKENADYRAKASHGVTPFSSPEWPR